MRRMLCAGSVGVNGRNVMTYRRGEHGWLLSRDARHMARQGWMATSTSYGGARRVGCLASLLFGFFLLLGGRKAGQLAVMYQRQMPAFQPLHLTPVPHVRPPVQQENGPGCRTPTMGG